MVCFKGSFCQLQQYRSCPYPEPEKMRSLMDYGGRCFSGNGLSNCIHLAGHSSAGSLFLTPAVQDNLYPTHCYAAQSIPADVPHYICVGSRSQFRPDTLAPIAVRNSCIVSTMGIHQLRIICFSISNASRFQILPIAEAKELTKCIFREGGLKVHSCIIDLFKYSFRRKQYKVFQLCVYNPGFTRM